MKLILLEPSIVGPWTAEKLGCTWWPGPATAIGLMEASPEGVPERLVAGAIFSDYNGAAVQVHLAAEPGAKWMTKAYLGFCFQYAFNQLGVNKVLGYVGSANEAAQRFDEHIGFRLETTIPGAHKDGTLLIYSMTREECRWLKIPVAKESIYGQE